MPIYEFSCKPCYERGVVSTWDMQFKMDEPKNTFCPRCGSPGHQVILTPPMIMGKDGSRERHQAADKMLERALGEQGITSVNQRHFRDHAENMAAQAERVEQGRDPAPPPPTDPMKARWGNASDLLGAGAVGAGGILEAGKAATAAQHAADAPTGLEVMGKLSKVLPSEAAVHPVDAAKGRRPTGGVRIN